MTDTYEFLKPQKDAILAKNEADENEWLKAAAEDIAHYKQERDLALAECERLNDTLDKLVQWSDAYPIAVFPEPDFTKAHKVLRENGMTLDAISASNMRHVIKGVREIIDAARGKP